MIVEELVVKKRILVRFRYVFEKVLSSDKLTFMIVGSSSENK